MHWISAEDTAGLARCASIEKDLAEAIEVDIWVEVDCGEAIIVVRIIWSFYPGLLFKKWHLSLPKPLRSSPKTIRPIR